MYGIFLDTTSLSVNIPEKFMRYYIIFIVTVLLKLININFELSDFVNIRTYS